MRFSAKIASISYLILTLNIVTKHFYFVILLLIINASTPVVAEPLRIVASIKPVHSLVASITKGVIEPELLIRSNQSPHHYSLKPSERRMLDKADLIFWIGPTMESFMPRLLDSLKNKNRAISLIETPNLKLLPLRQYGHGDDHDEHHHNDHPEQSTTDAHIWLNTNNVDILVEAITRQIIRIDPEHQQQYLTNSKQLHVRIAQIRIKLQQSLKQVNTTFLTYHDGYQYFENEFNLNNAGFIATSELQPGARHISNLKKLIQEKNIRCIFYEAPTEPPLLKSLLSQNTTKIFMLDPVGILIPSGENAWFEIMNLLSKQFINCQQTL